MEEVEEKDGSCGGQLRRGGSPCKAVAPVRHAVLTRAPWERGEPGERRERGVEARSCVGGMRRRRTLTVTCDWRRARMWRRISIYRKKKTSDHLARLTRTLSAASESVLSRSVFRTFADAAVGGPWVHLGPALQLGRTVLLVPTTPCACQTRAGHTSRRQAQFPRPIAAHEHFSLCVS